MNCGLMIHLRTHPEEELTSLLIPSGRRVSMGKKTHHVKPGNLGFSNKKHPSSLQRLTTQSFLWTKNRKHPATSLASKMNPIRTSFHHAPYSCLTKSQNPKKLMGEMSPFYRWLLDLYCASSPGSCNSIEESLPKAWMARLDGK